MANEFDYASIIADPNLMDPEYDISNIRTTTPTSQRLLADVPEYSGLKYDPTQRSYLEDLYSLYSGGLPTIPVEQTPVDTTPADTTPVDTGGGGGGLDVVNTPVDANTPFEQNLIDQGIGVQGAIGDPVVAPGEAPVTQQEIDEFNFPALTQDSTAEDISQDLANQQVMLNPTGGNIMDEVALTGGDTGILDSVSGALSGVSTAARNAFETVKDGTSTAVQFISDYGYPAYQALQGNLVAAGTALVNPLTLGLGFAGKIFESVGDTKSKQEYDSYSPEQQSEIDKAYGPGGVMEGYNAVSQFGEGPKATIQSRLDTRRANGISDSSPTSQKLIGLQDNLDITDFTQLTQEEISDMDDIDPADEGREIDFQTGEITGSPTGDVNIFDEVALTGQTPTEQIVDQGETSSDSGFSSSDEGETSSDAGFSDSSDFGGYDSGGYDPAPSPQEDPTDRGGGGGSSGGGGGKIVCTMMNETYGFGSFRNKIWQKYAKDNLTREHEKGYHKIFLPLVKLSKTNIVIRKILEHIAVHRTIDIRQEARGKTHILGRVYRKVLEPICYLVGKYAKR